MFYFKRVKQYIINSSEFLKNIIVLLRFLFQINIKQVHDFNINF